MATVTRGLRLLFLFCNDRDTTSTQAKQQAKCIQKALGGREVSVVYNFATFFNRERQDRVTTVIVERLKSSILKEIGGRRIGSTYATRIVVLAHGHGALIVELALALLSAQQRAHIEVYTFGGVVMCPQSLANITLNYVSDRDCDAFGANASFHASTTDFWALGLKREIAAIMRKDRVCTDEAIRSLAMKYFYISLKQAARNGDLDAARLLVIEHLPLEQRAALVAKFHPCLDQITADLYKAENHCHVAFVEPFRAACGPEIRERSPFAVYEGQIATVGEDIIRRFSHRLQEADQAEAAAE